MPRDTAAAEHADMVMYCLESSRQYLEWEYKDSTMLAAASEQRWHVIDAFDIHCRSINCLYSNSIELVDYCTAVYRGKCTTYKLLEPEGSRPTYTVVL